MKELRVSSGAQKYDLILESHFFVKVTQMGKRISAAMRLERNPEGGKVQEY